MVRLGAAAEQPPGGQQLPAAAPAAGRASGLARARGLTAGGVTRCAGPHGSPRRRQAGVARRPVQKACAPAAVIPLGRCNAAR